MRVLVIGILVVMSIFLSAFLLGAFIGMRNVSDWEKQMEDQDQLRAILEYNRKRARKRELRKARIEKITSIFRH